MAEQSGSTVKSDTFATEELEKTAKNQFGTQAQEKAKKSPTNKVKFEHQGEQNTDDSTKQKSVKSPGQKMQKNVTKIPVKSTGKQSKKNTDNFAAKENNLNAKVQDENSSKTGENSSKIGQNNSKLGHNRSKTESFISTEQESAVLKSRVMLENELLVKTKQVESLQKQLNDLKEAYESERATKIRQEISTDNEINVTTKSQKDSTNSRTEGQFEILFLQCKCCPFLTLFVWLKA